MSWTVATFNCNGIRARLPIILDWLASQRPQVLCLQETKVQDHDFPLEPLQEAGYQASFLGQKSYNGVAILSLKEPQQVLRGFGDGGEEDQARFIAAQIDGVWVLNTYVPQGQEVGSPAFSYKLAFFQRLLAWLRKRFKPGQELLWAGDLNVAPADLDVFDPKRLKDHVGCHPQERAALSEVTAWGLQDLFRLHHPDQKQFTFWDYRLPKSFERNLGWRLDHLLATEPLARRCREAQVDPEPRGRPKPSDHTFLSAVFKD